MYMCKVLHQKTNKNKQINKNKSKVAARITTIVFFILCHL